VLDAESSQRIRIGRSSMAHILPPVENVDRAGTRAVLEAFMQTNPVTGFLARIYQFTYPPQFQAQLADWRAEISARVSDHSVLLDELTQRLARRLVISDLAVSLGMKLVETEDAGLESMRDFEDVLGLIPEADSGAIAEALHELEHYGLLTTHATLAEPISHVVLRYEIYPAFDPVVIGYDTMADARHLAQLMVDNPERGSVPKLFAEVGWSRRRFNPALAYLLQFLEDGVISRELQAEFPTTYVFVHSRERFRLKQFIGDTAR
jgi:hypothetical protein